MAHTPLQKRLETTIRTALKKELGIENVHALPRMTRVVVNVGINYRKFGTNKDMHEYISDTLSKITGQKPSVRKSRKSIANFGIRENNVVGMAVTLNGKSMYQFMDRLVSYVLPRIRDFRGLPTKLDGHGNYSIGIKDQSIFPEIPAPEANKIFGMQIQISTNAGSDEKAMVLFKQIGIPFKRDQKSTKESVEAKA